MEMMAAHHDSGSPNGKDKKIVIGESAPAGGQMPAGDTGDTLASAAEAGQMPAGDMVDVVDTGEPAARAAEAGPMPAGMMGEVVASAVESGAGAGGQMPTGVMSAAVSGSTGSSDADDPGSPRIKPPDLPPGTLPPPSWEPGRIEVEFRGGVQPELVAAARGAAQISSPAGVDLGDLNRLLREYQLQRVEPAFGPVTPGSTPESSSRSARGANGATPAAADTSSADLPDLRNFFVLQFAPSIDVQQVARQLAQLPEIERAVAVPRAIPPQQSISEPLLRAAQSSAFDRLLTAPSGAPESAPQGAPAGRPPGTPLNEPLTGTGDQAVLNPSTGLENQWYIFRCRADRAWSTSLGNGVVIADIDWGYNIGHQDLAPRLDLTRAYNAYDGGSNVSHGTSISHGTAVMGLAGAADNGLGMAGFAPEATLWPVQANSGPGSPLSGDAWARAIEWVRTANSGGKRKVIVLEVQTAAFGNYEMIPSVNAAIRTAIASGVVVCVAAGNGDRDASIDDSGNPIPPTGSILVGAAAYHPTENRRATFSNYGSQVTVTAPGDSAHDLTCNSTGNTAYRNGFGGTSGATPKVAGTVALMLAANPSLTHAQIRSFLNQTGTAVVTQTGKPVGTFLNAEAAVLAARNSARWRGWATLAGNGKHAPAAAAWRPNRLDTFLIGNDNAVWHKWWDGAAWRGWESLGGVAAAAPTAAAWGPNRLDCFILGNDNAVWRKWYDGTLWRGWESLGGNGRYAPAAAAWGPNRLDLFLVGSDSAVWHKWWDGTAWRGWESLGGTAVSAPAVASWGPNRLDLFIRGADNALWHKWYDGTTWRGWESLGGNGKHAPAAASWGPNRLDTFLIGNDNAVWRKWWDGTVWRGWESLGGTAVSAPAAAAWGANRLDLFILGTDNALWHKWWA